MQNEFEVVNHHEIEIDLTLKKFSAKFLDIPAVEIYNGKQW